MKLLDLKDWKILEILCTEARTSHASIAKTVGLSKNSVTYRVERLVKKGVIQGFFTIIDEGLLGSTTYNFLLRLKGSKEREPQFLEFLKKHPNTLVVDRLLGEWDWIIELACLHPLDFNLFLRGLQENFSDIIDNFEVHPVLTSYKVEQLPVELVKERPVAQFPQASKSIKLDDFERKLLFELGRNASAPLVVLAHKLGVTYETIAARIKQLKLSGVIVSFTAKISLYHLGYEVYLIRLDLKNMSTERAASFRSHFNAQRNIRYAFISAFAPVIFVYLAVKNADGLNEFLVSVKEKFSDIVMNQSFFLCTELVKYDLFPECFLKE